MHKLIGDILKICPDRNVSKQFGSLCNIIQQRKNACQIDILQSVQITLQASAMWFYEVLDDLS